MSSERYHDHFIVSWDQLHRDVRALCHTLIGRDFKGIIAITRGGLIPAGLIARELGIRHIDTVCIKSYHDHMEQGGLEVVKGVDHDGDGWLLVDDLVDTGNTARAVRDMLPKAHFVTVYAKPEGRPLVDGFITEVPQNCWIQFPWDMGIAYVEPISEQLKKQESDS